MRDTILFVESDDSDISKLVKYLESFFAIQKTSLQSLQTHLVKEHTPSFILIPALLLSNPDCPLPSLLSSTTFSRLPVLCLSENILSEDCFNSLEQKVLDLGALSLINKPYHPQILLQKIRNLIKLNNNSFLSNIVNSNNFKISFHEESDSGDFWNQQSLDYILMPDYTGAACIFELANNHITILRTNDAFVPELIGPDNQLKPAHSLSLSGHMDDSNRLKLLQILKEPKLIGDQATCDLMFRDIGVQKSYVHLHFTVRLLQFIDNRKLFYCSIENDTKEFFEERTRNDVVTKLSQILQNMNGGVIAAYRSNGNTIYLYTNDVFYSIFGYTKEQFENELFGDIYPRVVAEERAYVKEQIHSSTIDQPVELETRFVKRDGSIVWIRITNTIRHLDSIPEPVYFTIFKDISAQKEYDKRIHMINQRLGNSEIFIKLELTKQVLLDYHSIYATEAINDTDSKKHYLYEDLMLSSMYDDDKNNAKQVLSYSGLLDQYNNGETRLSFEYRRYLPSGAIHWFVATAILIEGLDGDSINALIYSHDIDERMKKRLAKNRIIDNDVDDITIINLKNKTSQIVKLYHGSALTNMTAAYADNVRTYIENEVVDEDKASCYSFFQMENIIRDVELQGYAEHSYWLHTNSGINRRKNAHITYLDSTQEDLLMVGRDITTLFEQEMEQKLVLQQAVDMANYANQAKSDFLSRMSHDMRTPLNAILGVTTLAKNENTSASIANYLDSIDISGQYLLGLINDTLDLSKIESGKLDFHKESYPLSEFVLGINTVIKPLMDARNIHFDMHLANQTTNIAVDKMRFNQIFYNLLSNAAKYTDEGGHVDFSSEAIPPKDNKFGMRFHIKDDGIGMSKDYQKILFEPFTRETRVILSERKGSGLGLAIVKRIVDLSGGSIRVVSELDKGTEFIVDLYANCLTGENETTFKRELDMERIHGLHILLVDDTQINSLIFKRILEFKGAVVTTAENGQEALDIFSESEDGFYDIILTDIRMPVMDGLEEARQIRAMERTDAKTIPIIAATADAYTDIMEKITKAGMNGRLVKPVKPEELFEMIINLLP